MNLLQLYQHILYAEINLITLVSYLQRYAESVRKSRKMPTQLGLTAVPGMMLACLCSTLTVIFL
jgi:hypothetical protein